MSTGPYDPTKEFVDARDDDDTDLSDYDAGIDESPDVNDDGEIVSSSSDEEVRDFATEDDRDVSDDNDGTTKTRKTTLDQTGLDGENIFAGSSDENTDNNEPYDPTDEFENDPDYRKGGVGGGRKATLEAIEQKDNLGDVDEDDIETLDDLKQAVGELHLDAYMSPPTDVIDTIESVYNGLPDDAKPHYLTDDVLLERINSARQYFDETLLPRLKREKEMPSPVEAGRANYPADKARRVSEKSREASKEMKEKLGTATGVSNGILSAARGARQRALNEIGSSVAEENEKEREKTREEMKDRVETGDLVVYGMPTPSVGEVIRVNKKSVTARRPNPQYGNEDPLTGEKIDKEWSEGRAKFTESTLSLIEEEDLDTLGEDTRANNISQDSFDSFDELRKDVGLPIERESRYVDNKDRECTQRLADKAHITEDRAATIVEHFGDYETVIQDASVNRLTRLDGIGEKTAEKVVEISDNNTNMTRSSSDDNDDVDELAHDTPPTWEVEATPEDDEHGWSYVWECETGDRVHAGKSHNAQSYHVEIHGGSVDGEYEKIAGGLPSKRDAVEVAIGTMGANKCNPAQVNEYSIVDSMDTGISSRDLAVQDRITRQAEKESRKLEAGEASMTSLPDSYDPVEDIRGESESSDETVPYDPTVKFDDVFGGDEPDEETREEVVAETDKTEDNDSKDSDESEEPQNPMEVEFGAKDVADDLRDEHDGYLHEDDDRRLKTVRFVQDTPDNVLEDARAAATETRADKTKDSYGQTELTEREKGEIDFSENSVFHARTAKAIAAGEGVSNWLDYYDPTLTTDEHIEVYKNAEAASRLDSDELDDETVDEKLAEMEKTAESEECNHAERGCKDGYEEACEFLVEECGVNEDRVDELLEEDDFNVFEDEAGEVPDIEDVEIDEDELPASVLVAFKKAWNGYRAGRAEAEEGVENARKYAGIINSIRRGIGQELMEFEETECFEGGEVAPEEAGVDEFDAAQTIVSGGVSVYDPTKDIA